MYSHEIIYRVGGKLEQGLRCRLYVKRSCKLMFLIVLKYILEINDCHILIYMYKLNMSDDRVVSKTTWIESYSYFFICMHVLECTFASLSHQRF